MANLYFKPSFFKCCSRNQRVSPALLLTLLSLGHSPWCTVPACPACCSSCPAALHLPFPQPCLNVSQMPFFLLPAPTHFPAFPQYLHPSLGASGLRMPILAANLVSIHQPQCHVCPSVSPASVMQIFKNSILEMLVWIFFPKQRPHLTNTIPFLFFSCSPTRCPWYSLLMRFTPSPLLSPTAMSTFPRGHTRLTSPLTSAPNKVSPSFPSTVGMHGAPGALCAADRATITSW